MLGSLPVVVSFCRRLGIAEVIDEVAPIRDVAAVTAGQAVEAMICNRLTSPAPLVHVQDWARTWAVAEILGIAPASLNDDKLGRTLDAIAPQVPRSVVSWSTSDRAASRGPGRRSRLTAAQTRASVPNRAPLVLARSMAS